MSLVQCIYLSFLDMCHLAWEDAQIMQPAQRPEGFRHEILNFISHEESHAKISLIRMSELAKVDFIS